MSEIVEDFEKRLKIICDKVIGSKIDDWSDEQAEIDGGFGPGLFKPEEIKRFHDLYDKLDFKKMNEMLSKLDMKEGIDRIVSIAEKICNNLDYSRYPSEGIVKYRGNYQYRLCPTMPQRLAREVGNYSLRGRMLAGAIFEQMCEKGETTPQEWRENKELHQKFYEELDRAQKMPTTKAFKQYIPNTAVNRKRLVAMGMEEKGIENTEDNFKELYRTMRENGVFEKTLANPEEAKTTINARLLVKHARQKGGK